MLQQIRAGDFFYTHQWLQYLEASCALSADQMDLDTLIGLASWELLTNDFQSKDCSVLKLFNAVICDHDGFDIPGKHIFANTVLISAALQVLVYMDADTLEFYKNKPIDASIAEWMNRDNPKLDARENNDAIAEKQQLFEMDRETIKYSPAKAGIEYMVRLTCAMDEMSAEKRSEAAIRLGVIQSMVKQLLSEPEPDVLAQFVIKIRSLNPQAWEESYLPALSPVPKVAEPSVSTNSSFNFFGFNILSHMRILPEIGSRNTPPRSTGPGASMD